MALATWSTVHYHCRLGVRRGCWQPREGAPERRLHRGRLWREPREIRDPRDLTPRQAHLFDGEDQRLPREGGDRPYRAEQLTPIARGASPDGTSVARCRPAISIGLCRPHWRPDQNSAGSTSSTVASLTMISSPNPLPPFLALAVASPAGGPSSIRFGRRPVQVR